MTKSQFTPVMPYGVAIQQAIAAGDLAQMTELAARTEKWLADQDALRQPLAALKAEIALVEKAAS